MKGCKSTTGRGILRTVDLHVPPLSSYGGTRQPLSMSLDFLPWIAESQTFLLTSWRPQVHKHRLQPTPVTSPHAVCYLTSIRPCASSTRCRNAIDIASEICIFSSMTPHTLHFRTQRIPDLIPGMPPCVNGEQKYTYPICPTLARIVLLDFGEVYHPMNHFRRVGPHEATPASTRRQQVSKPSPRSESIAKLGSRIAQMPDRVSCGVTKIQGLWRSRRVQRYRTRHDIKCDYEMYGRRVVPDL